MMVRDTTCGEVARKEKKVLRKRKASKRKT